MARLRFAEILLERPNLLFLDEPTNHLDIYTRESLGRALAAYEGTLILVTHDRYLMNSLACPILYLQDGSVCQFENYEALMRRDRPEEKVVSEKVVSARPAYGKEQRKRKAELRAKIKALEDEMEMLELKIMDLEGAINDPEILKDHIQLQKVCDDLDDARFRQDEAYNEWGLLMEEQETYEQEDAKNV